MGMFENMLTTANAHDAAQQGFAAGVQVTLEHFLGHLKDFSLELYEQALIESKKYILDTNKVEIETKVAENND